jgi:hypothetical protein
MVVRSQLGVCGEKLGSHALFVLAAGMEFYMARNTFTMGPVH